LNNFYPTDFKEQETIINIDYFERTIHIYTCRKSIALRLYKILGEPTNSYITQNQISGVKWIIPFHNRKSIRNILSRPVLIGNFK